MGCNQRPQQGFADVNGTRLYYEVGGAGPTLVLIHGFGLDSGMWGDQFLHFARSYQVMRYDMRGFGQSMMPDNRPYAHSDDLRALLTYLGMEQPTIIGLSMGGRVAIDFALAYPARIYALILIDTGLEETSRQRQTQERFRRIAREAGVEAAKRLRLDSELFAPVLEQPEVAARFMRVTEAFSGWHWLNNDPAYPLRPLAAQQLDEINVPTLVLVGERDVPDLRAISEHVARHVPHAHKAVVPDVGHMASMEAPEHVNDLIHRFLATHEMKGASGGVEAKL